MKNVIVTGVSRGIGRGIAVHLASKGYKVYGTFNTGQVEADSLKQQLGSSIELFQVDFTDRSGTKRFISEVSNVQLNGIVNNAGMIEFEDFEDFDFSIRCV